MTRIALVTDIHHGGTKRGDTAQVLLAPRHAYTRRLLAAVPRAEAKALSVLPEPENRAPRPCVPT